MGPVQVEGRLSELPVEPQRVVRELAQEVNVWAGYVFVGTGDPENVIVANRGALFLRTDGGAGTCLYVKEADDGLSTGWAGK